MAQAYRRMEQHELALDALNASLEISSEFWYAYMLRAKIYTELEDYAKSDSDARRAIELKPNKEGCWGTLLDLEFSRNASVEDTRLAAREAAQALGATALLAAEACWNLRLNRRQEYERVCRNAFATFAGSSISSELSATAYCAAIAQEPAIDANRVEEIARRASSMKNTPENRHVLGLALLRAGKPKEAIEEFKKSMNEPWQNEAISWVGLAIAHASLEDCDVAEDCLSTAKSTVDLKPLSSPYHIAWELLVPEAEHRIDMGVIPVLQDRSLNEPFQKVEPAVEAPASTNNSPATE
jgi:Flp pilus assembly protein TadD